MITDSNIDPGANIDIGKIGFPYILSGKHTDGTLPQLFWVSAGGADSAGATGVSHVGTRKEPFLTIAGTGGALRYTVDGRGDRIILGPNTWRENLDFGSGTGTTGVAGRMNKRDIGIYGSGGAHPGRTQIVGDGTTTGPTVRVRDGYLRGFTLSDLEIGSVTTADVDRALPLLDLESVSGAVLTATISDTWAVLRNVRLSSDTTATAGLVLTGATMVRGYDLHIAGVIRGIVLRASSLNNPDTDEFFNTRFNDNVTADIITTVGEGQGAWTFTAGTLSAMGNVNFFGNKYLDRGGTPVTNYVNAAVTTITNCGDYDFFSARDVADGTLMLLPVDWIAIGRSAVAAEFIIGA